MSSDDIAIRVSDVSKHYVLFDRPEDRLKQMVIPRLERLAGRTPRRYYRDFAALTDVSFEVKRGETVGIVGRNGSGKSTLLQIICGTLQPTRGKVEVKGRIAALLELGAGFNPEFSGRENVYLNAAILGLSRSEIEHRFDDIARFADIGAFIEQPVKTYSSGMYVRLAFATAINVDPDILVVDEALAVGDEAFQRKCYARIEEIKDRGGTILFVSHSAQTIVQLCTRAALFDRGEFLLQGQPKAVVGQYQRLANASAAAAHEIRKSIAVMRDAVPAEPAPAPLAPVSTLLDSIKVELRDVGDKPPVRKTRDSCPANYYDPNLLSKSRINYKSEGATIRDLRLLNDAGDTINILEVGQRYTYQYFVDFDTEARNVGFGMLVNTKSGLGIAGATTAYSKMHRTPLVRPGCTAQVRFEFNCVFLPGFYLMNAGVIGIEKEQERYLHRILDGLAFRVAPISDSIATGLIDISARPHVAVVIKEHNPV